MVDSTLSILIRDTYHPCAPYQSTGHNFYVSIYTCDGQPLFWKGILFENQLLDVRGKARGFIHGQVKVPPGCYLIRVVATCKNIVSDWAWVSIGCDETVCVNLVFPHVVECLIRTAVGLMGGTIDPPEGELTVQKAMPNEVEEAVRALRVLIAKLPKGVLPPPPTAEEIQALERKTRTQAAKQE